jgi:hypothetical protein
MPLPSALLASTLALLLGATAAAQTVDVVGTSASRSQRTALAKGNSFRVDTTVVLDSFEMWFDFSGAQTVEFYIYRCPTEGGTYTQLLRTSVPLTGNGPGWYSSGALQFPLICGGHYVLATSWPGTLAYYFGTGNSQPVSFGEHTFAYALGTHPLPASFTTTSNDQAIYHMRLLTNAPGAGDPDVDCVGTSCATSGAPAPELGTAFLPRTGTPAFAFLLSGSVSGRIGAAMVTPGLLPFPIPIAGSCELFVDPTVTFVLLGPATLDAAGAASFAAPIPPDVSLRGARVAAQAFVLEASSGALDTSNALDLLLN